MEAQPIKTLVGAAEAHPAKVGAWEDVPHLTDGQIKIIENVAKEVPHDFFKGYVDGRRALLIVEAAKPKSKSS